MAAYSRFYTVAALAAGAVGVAAMVWAFNLRAASERADSERDAASTVARDEIAVAMKWSFAGTMAPYFAAQINGIFDDAGISVTLLESGPTLPKSVQQVVLGNAQFGITGAHELAEARSRDQPLVSVAVIFKLGPACLISPAARGIRAPGDLVDKVVEMTSGDNAEFEYLAMLKRAGVDASAVHTQVWPWHYKNLLDGKADAVVVYENDQAITLRQDFEKLKWEPTTLCPRNFGVTPYADVLFTTEDLMEKNPDLVGRVVTAWLEAWESAARNQSDTVARFLRSPDIAQRGFDAGVQQSVLEKSIEFVTAGEAIGADGHYKDIGFQDAARWNETIDLLREYGNVEKLPEASDLFSNRWVQQHRYAEHASPEGSKPERDAAAGRTAQEEHGK